MTNFLPVIALLVSISVVQNTVAIGCQKPAVNGQHVIGVDGKECVALVKEKCGTLKSRKTTSWSRGIKVRDSCTTIPTLTAIATFAGPENKYAGGSFKHAAIFDKCDDKGIWVYDQWNDSAGVQYRRLAWTGTGSNGGDNFYTIL